MLRALCVAASLARRNEVPLELELGRVVYLAICVPRSLGGYLNLGMEKQPSSNYRALITWSQRLSLVGD